MSSALADILTVERSLGLRRLAGSHLSGVIPIRQGLIDRVLARWRQRRVVEELRVRLLADRHVHVSADIKVFGFRKHVEATLKLPQAVDFRERPTVRLQFVERSALALVASLAAPILGGLPAGIALSESAVTIDLPQFLSRAGAADLLPHIKSLSFDSDDGVVWLNVAIEIVPPNQDGPRTISQVRSSGTSHRRVETSELIPLLGGTRLAIDVRAQESLVTELLGAVLTEAANRAGGSPSTDSASVTRFIAPPRIRFEPETMVLETELRIDQLRT